MRMNPTPVPALAPVAPPRDDYYWIGRYVAKRYLLRHPESDALARRLAKDGIRPAVARLIESKR